DSHSERSQVRIGAGRHLASHIAQARFVGLDGADHWVFAGDQQPVLDNVRQFVGNLNLPTATSIR
ncbi:hypothetical protein SB769_39800, partial [Burkholderia sp. SIMBA_024]